MNLIEKAAERLKLAKRDGGAALPPDLSVADLKVRTPGSVAAGSAEKLRPSPVLPAKVLQPDLSANPAQPSRAAPAAAAPPRPAAQPVASGNAEAVAPAPDPTPTNAEPGATAPQGRRSRIAVIDPEVLKANGISVGPDDHTSLAEEFRLIKRPMLLKAFGKGPNKVRNGHVIMVTSARPGEGKTFCALSLALSIAAERDLTVLLIDADIAKPEVCKRLGIQAERGLTDVLDDEKLDLADVMIRTNQNKLSVVPAGQPKALATELLASERMERLVEDIATRYPDRVIIFDSPPVLASSAPGVLALHVGQVLFVVEAERTPQAAVESALSHLSGCEHIGVVLNKTRDHGKAEQMGHYYPYYGSN
ncbi:MAG: XrtA-associated tyrosine autokinase [Alphaproteobacteria bacterium]